MLSAVSRAVSPSDALDPDCSQWLDMVRGGSGLGEMRFYCLPVRKVRGLCKAFESCVAGQQFVSHSAFSQYDNNLLIYLIECKSATLAPIHNSPS